MTTQVIWIRHAQTLANQEQRYLGHADSPLTEVGLQQEQRLLKALHRERIVAVYGSDLPRVAKFAACIAADHQSRVTFVPELREMDFGVFEGMRYPDIMENFPDEATAFYGDLLHHRPPKGESGLDVLRRVRHFYHMLVKEIQEEPLGTRVVVSHGGPLRLLFADLQFGDPLRHFDFGIAHGMGVRSSVSVTGRLTILSTFGMQ